MFQHKNIIPQFYFPGGFVSQEVNDFDENLIKKLFIKDEITEEELIPLTVELFDFPKMFNSVVFNKINSENKPKISKNTFIKYKANLLSNFNSRQQIKIIQN